MSLVSPLSKLAFQPGGGTGPQSSVPLETPPPPGAQQGNFNLYDLALLAGPLIGGALTGFGGAADLAGGTGADVAADTSADAAGAEDTANATLPSTNIGTGDVPLSSAAPTGNMASGSSGLSNLRTAQQISKLANLGNSTNPSGQQNQPAINIPLSAAVPLPNLSSNKTSTPNVQIPNIPSEAAPNLSWLNTPLPSSQSPGMNMSVRPQSPLLQLIQQTQNQQGDPNSPNTPLQSTNIPQGMGQLPQGVNTGNLAALSGAQDATGAQPASGFDTPMLRQLSQYIQNVPQPSDYAPSRMQRVMASLAGMGGSVGPTSMWGGVPVGFKADTGRQFEITKAIEQAPYEKALQNYQIKGQALEKGAGIEERDIANRRAIQESSERIAETTRENKARDADREVQRERQQQDSDTRLQKVTDYADKMAAALKEKQDEFAATQQRLKDESNRKEGDFQAQLKLRDQMNANLLELHKAENDARQARFDAQQAQQKAEADRKAADYEKRISDLSKPKPIEPTETTVTKTVPGKTGLFGSTSPWLGGKSDVTTITKTNKGPVGSYVNPNPPPQQQGAPVKTREMAIAALTAKQKPVNEANIKHLLDNPGEW
jgi:hypothetical protein